MFKSDNTLFQKAHQFAKQKHSRQKRKFTGEPYIGHPENVFNVLAQITDDVNVLAAGLLHDTIEDTETTYEDIKLKFNQKIADLVLELTSDRDQIRLLGKEQYLVQKMSSMSDRAFIIKLVDRMDNLKDLDKTDCDFTKKYVEETEFILKNLKRKLDKHEEALVTQIQKYCSKARKLCQL